MKIIVITKEELFAEEPQLINRLFEAGLECLHLRKPKATIDEQRKLIQAVDAKYHSRMVLHDCFELTKAFDLKGIHLNSRNAKPAWALPNLTVSKSCHSLDELKDISAFNYVFLSPIFDSISKTGYRQAFSAEELLQAKKEGLINEKVIALGGVTKENRPIVQSFGFGGAAILGTLWNSSNAVVERFQELNTKQINATIHHP